MRLSKTIEQACCILAIVAEHHGDPVTNVELSERMQVSGSYLTKITRKLVVAGILHSTYGVNGGFLLAQPMASITLRAVVVAIEGGQLFFQSDNVIKRAFPSKAYVASRGVKLLEGQFSEAEQDWYGRLELVTMEKLISDATTEL